MSKKNLTCYKLVFYMFFVKNVIMKSQISCLEGMVQDAKNKVKFTR